MAFKIKHFIAKNGERFSQLYCYPSDGFPLFYSTAYFVRNMRNNITGSTQRTYLSFIKKLYEWEESTNLLGGQHTIDIHQRLISKTFFKAYEIDSLTSFIAMKKSSKIGEVISGEKVNLMQRVISDYLKWYADEVITDSNQPLVQSAIKKMVTMIVSRKYKRISKTRAVQNTLSKKLTDETRKALVSLFSNPLTDIHKQSELAPRFRNILALRILYETGMRKGELLSLRLRNFIPSSGGEPDLLWVSRYHDDKLDDRINQPVAKTLERPVPISKELADCIIEYLKEWRAKTDNVGFDEYEPLLVIHQKGARQGKGFTEVGLNSMLNVLAKKFIALNGLHPHLLRHDWNYRFSLEADKRGYTEKEECEQREFMMGWVEGSDMPKLYNRRRIQEQAFKIGLEVASHSVLRRRL